MRTAILLLATLLLVPAHLTVARPSFDALKGKATAVEDLGHFLDDYVGDCGRSADRRDCERNAAAHRRGLSGHLFYTRLPDAMSQLLQVGPKLGAGRVRLYLTPVFGGSGYGLTRGRPHRLDARGNPRMRLMPLTGTLPAGMSRRSLDLAVHTENVTLELLFRPGRIWRISGHGHHAEGVAARFAGLRVEDARSGAVIVSRIF